MGNVGFITKSRICSIFNVKILTWVAIYRANKLLVTFWETHTKQEKCYIEILEYGNKSYKICKSARIPDYI